MGWCMDDGGGVVGVLWGCGLMHVYTTWVGGLGLGSWERYCCSILKKSGIGWGSTKESKERKYKNQPKCKETKNFPNAHC